ncbi:hypothetical protein RFI_17233 [Reticulomyxa filosa]|uniref:Rab-GAP TBC domain-containing protein n=1 Tax=Reticulomyxa filosa TaxID=46433 RepID=X6N145_RETFI|nr:hypothetical protein RFI_17233 [Reticulomyxa filosa]|eukprot:ETO19985.1 hypothetical protein RFI_17233 [Reticulomyxa filosa]
MLFPKKQKQTTSGGDIEALEAQIKQWDSVKSNRKLKLRIRKGIPQAMRGHVWQNLCGARERQLEKYKESKSTRFYHNLVEMSESPYHDQIWKDIYRTYRKQVRFGMVGLAKSQSQPSSQSQSQSRVDSPTQTKGSKNANSNSNGNDNNSNDSNSEHKQSVMRESSIQNVATLTTSKASKSQPLASPKQGTPKKQEEDEKTGETTFHRDVIQDSNKIVTFSDLEKNPTDAQKQLYNVLKENLKKKKKKKIQFKMTRITLQQIINKK